jgi:hypothetical protein
MVAVIVWHNRSEATIVEAIDLDGLTRMSEWVVVATVKSARSHYERIGSARRLVTDTLLQVDQALTPNRTSASVETATVMVRTLGGSIGDLVQWVPGEAILPQGARQLLFLDEGNDLVLRVSAMAQGHYPIVLDDQGHPRLQQSPGLDLVIHPEQSAVTTLVGHSIDEAEAMLQNVRRLP